MTPRPLPTHSAPKWVERSEMPARRHTPKSLPGYSITWRDVSLKPRLQPGVISQFFATSAFFAVNPQFCNWLSGFGCPPNTRALECGLWRRRSIRWTRSTLPPRLRRPSFLHHFCTISASLFAMCFSQPSPYQSLPLFPRPHGAIPPHPGNSCQLVQFVSPRRRPSHFTFAPNKFHLKIDP